MDGNPLLKKTKKTKKEEEKIVKEKPRISIASAKRITASDEPLDNRAVAWLEIWIENYLRNNSLPLQFLCNDFESKLMSFVPPFNAEWCIKRLREDFKKDFPFTKKEPEDMKFLEDAVELDSKSPLKIDDGNKSRD